MMALKLHDWSTGIYITSNAVMIIMDGCLILFLWSRYVSSVFEVLCGEWKPASNQKFKLSDPWQWQSWHGFSEARTASKSQQIPSTWMRAPFFSHVTPSNLWFDPGHGLTNTFAALVISLRWCPNVKVDLPSIGFLAWRRKIKIDTSFQYQQSKQPFSTWYCGPTPKSALSSAVLSLVSPLSSFRLIQHAEQFHSDNVMLSLPLCRVMP